MSRERKYLRFTISDRFEHWVQMVAFATLGLTGTVQRYSELVISLKVISALGGIETVRIVHRFAAVLLMFGVIYHIGTAGYKIYVKRARPKIIPSMFDVRAAWDMFLYNLGRQERSPQQDRYTFDEKFEYWAFVWGTIVMGLTGFMLWNPIATSRFLPGTFIPAAKTAHSLEAVLAVLAIIIWHFYNVHIKHLNRSMFTGYLTEEEMLEEHIIELADIKAGIEKPSPDPLLEAKRRKVFFPVYGVAVMIMLFGVYAFVSFEETAITTRPPAENVEVFVPLTPTPLPTPIPTPTLDPMAGKTWDETIGDLLGSKCGACHGDTALGGLKMSTYQTVMKGGIDGPIIVPGDPDASLIIQRQIAGNHPGQLSEDEFTLIREWIEAGAPEN